MKKDVRIGCRRNTLMLLPALIMLVSPVIVQAQADDVYFVPTKKSEKAIVVESVAEKYNVKNIAKSAVRDVDEYNRRSTAISNEPEAYVEENADDGYSAVMEEYQDYDFSTRIIRFHTPRSTFGPLYWDFVFGGINDWYVYDNGYNIDIYPTASNPFYYWGSTPFYWNSMSYRHWMDWYGLGHYPYWGWNHYGHHHHYNGYWCDYNWYYNHMHHYPHIGGHLNSKRPRGHIPHNGAVSSRDRNDKSIPVNVASRNNGKDTGRVSGRDTGKGRVDLRGVKKENTRTDNSSVTGNRNSNTQKNNTGKVNLRGSERNGSGRSVSGAGQERVNNRQTNGARRQQPARTNVESSKKQSNPASGARNGSVNRRSSSSGSYNRQSSTSVSRSRSSSGSSRSSSGSSYRSSSRSSGNSSSYSGGSSSRSSSGASRSSGRSR